MHCDKGKETCQTTCESRCCGNGISEHLIIIVLYILLAIILSACLHY